MNPWTYFVVLCLCLAFVSIAAGAMFMVNDTKASTRVAYALLSIGVVAALNLTWLPWMAMRWDCTHGRQPDCRTEEVEP